MRSKALTALALLMLWAGARVTSAPATSPFRDWKAPFGVPAPAFGILEAAPASPTSWKAPSRGFYYVDQAARGATDENNPFGSAIHPRRTVPQALPAGAVVELHGPYDASHSSPRTLVASGTADRPVFIRGASPAARPLVRNGWEIRGSYFILENLEFGPRDESHTGTLVIRAPTKFAAVRGCELHGTPQGGGMGIVSWDASAATEQVVVLKNSIHDNGNVRASFDQDVHGIAVSDRVHHLWVVDNELARNSGDGIQVNAGRNQAATTHHVYIARNVAHDNKQTGFWVKQATDVIVSQNLSYHHRPGNSSMGQCMGGQYAPDYIWFLFNHVHDCEYGIALMSDDGERSHVFVVGNVVHDIHRTVLKNNPEDAWGPAGILLAGGFERYVVGNTIADVDAGINVPSPLGTLEVVDNIVGPVTLPQASHLNIGFAALAGHTKFHHDLLFRDPRVATGDSARPISARELAAVQSMDADPRFVNQAAHDFRLTPDSPAVGRGMEHPVYAAFAGRYGINVLQDAAGVPRRLVVSLGAFEPHDARATDRP